MPLTNHPFSANFGSAYTGLAGTVGYQLRQADGTAVGARVKAGIAEPDAGSGSYIVTVASVADNVAHIVWDTGGGSPVFATEDVGPYHDRAAILTDTDAGGPGPWTTATGFAVPADKMDLIDDAVDSDSVATSGAQEIRDEILDDATRFSGADIGTIETSTTAGGSGPWTTAAGFAVPGDAMTLEANSITAGVIATDAIDADAIATDAIDADALAADAVAEIASAVDAAITGSHGSGDYNLSAADLRFLNRGKVVDVVETREEVDVVQPEDAVDVEGED